MGYQKIGWNTTSTPLSPSNLNHMDTQYDEVMNALALGAVPIILRTNPLDPQDGEIYWKSEGTIIPDTVVEEEPADVAEVINIVEETEKE